MIFILKDADFSKNNIGKIVIERELDNRTKKLLEMYSTSLPKNKQYAIDDFLIGLYNYGIIDKITCLLLPCISSSLNEAMINVINGESMGILNDEYWVLRNYGLVQTSVTYGTTEAITRIDAYKDVPINNNHYAVYNSESYEYINSNDTAKQFPTRRNSNTTFYDNCTASLGTLWLHGSKYGGISITTENSSFLFGIKLFHQLNTLNDTLSIKHGIDDKIENISEVSFPSTYIDSVSICGNGNNGIKAHSLYSFGYSMTDEEQNIYAELVENLMKVLLS